VGFVPATDPAHALPIDVVSELDEFTEANEFCCLEFHLGFTSSLTSMALNPEIVNCQRVPRPSRYPD
jgi:hypothetical protein